MSSIAEIMATDLVSIPPTATIAEAATVMGGRRVGSALVMEGDQLLGIFTERDTVRALSQDFDAPGHPVSHWMTKDPMCVGPDTSVDHALELMLQRGFRHLPVTDAGRVVGMVSIRDLSRSERQQLGGG
jgi:CBS domain-containing protein